MLSDADPDKRRVAVNKIQKIRSKNQEASTSSTTDTRTQRNTAVRKFVIPNITENQNH